MKYLMVSLIGLALLVIGVAIDGRIDQVNKVSTNIPYGLGYCLYKTAGNFENCMAVAWRRLTDKEYKQCMKDTTYPAACLGHKDVIES